MGKIAKDRNTNADRKLLAIGLLTWVALVGPARGAEPATSSAMPDVIGVTHVAGTYHRTDEEFLGEGARVIRELGSRVIKVYLTVPPEARYPFATKWPKVRSLRELADTPPYRSLFAQPFNTFILTTYSVGRPDHGWLQGSSTDALQDDERQFEELTRYLLETYRGTGKTFVLQHWEGDWAIRGNFDLQSDPSRAAISGMIDWLNARQRGVERARATSGGEGVQVYHAAEVNLVKIALRDGRPTVADQVLPHVSVDLVSYSAWDTQQDARLFREALDYLARHTRDHPRFGDRNIYIGEFGLPENEHSQEVVEKTVSQVIETACDWGCPCVVYWQVYCNEARRTPVASNVDVRGFWLVRPDGTKGWAWDVLESAIRKNR